VPIIINEGGEGFTRPVASIGETGRHYPKSVSMSVMAILQQSADLIVFRR
jgi:hypothetical protein